MPLARQVDKREGADVAGRPRDDEIELLSPACPEVAHLEVDAEDDFPGLGVVPEKPALLEQVEQDAPAADLRVEVGARVVLPARAGVRLVPARPRSPGLRDA